MRAKEWPEQVGLMVSQALGAAERGAWFNHHDKPRMRSREKVSASEVASIAIGIALELMTENSRQDRSTTSSTTSNGTFGSATPAAACNELLMKPTDLDGRERLPGETR